MFFQSFKKYVLWVLVGVLVVGGVAYGSYQYGLGQRPSIEFVQGVSGERINEPANVDFSLFWDAWRMVQQKYVNRTDLDPQKMVYGAIEGMLNSLGDPYTTFFDPAEAQRFMEDVSGSFEGIGAEIGLRNGVITIIKPLDNSPASKAGIKSGDVILKIDGKDISNFSLDSAVSAIRGPKGTEVTLSVLHTGANKPQDISIIRDTISSPTLTYSLSSDRILTITLSEFSSDVIQKFNDMARQFATNPPRGIILDLRDDPGGYLDVAQTVASYFIPEGQTIVTESFGNGEPDTVYRSYGYHIFENTPMVVLVNGGSASASEILAGALRDDRHITLIGEKTYGKGSVQELDDLAGGTKIKITVAKWLTPSGQSIMNNGLDPDIKVDLTDQDIQAGKDPQMDKAQQVLMQAIGK